MAASIILDDIRTFVYNTTEYPEFICNEDEDDEFVPKSLALLCLIKSKSNILKRKQTAISHAIISACRPRSFISPILLSIALCIHRKYELKDLIRFLNALGFSDGYRQVRWLNSAFLNKENPDYSLDGLFNLFLIMLT